MIFSEEDYHVAHLSAQLAKAMGYDNRTAEDIGFAAKWHDIGKRFVPPTILNKPSKLTDEEYAVIKTHTELGHRIVSQSFFGRLGVITKEVCLLHHENYDGSGYYGISHWDTPLYVQIVHLVDVYVALHSKRSYKEPWSDQQIITYLTAQSGKMFNPALVAVFLSLLDTTGAESTPGGIYETTQTANPTLTHEFSSHAKKENTPSTGYSDGRSHATLSPHGTG